MSKEVDDILEAFLQENISMIERVVGRALRAGRQVSELAFDLERGLDEKVRGGCAPRAAVANRWRTHPHPNLTDAKRNELADLILETSADDIPVAIVIVTPRVTICGVKRLEGDVLLPPKAN